MSTERPRVLVVEDDADHPRALTLTLHLGGYATTECGSGEEALDQLGRIVTNPDELRAMVLDVRLPGIDGLEVLTKLCHELCARHLRVVLISAHATVPNSVQSDDHTDFVANPSIPINFWNGWPISSVAQVDELHRASTRNVRGTR